jgi:hypothetical protein
LDANGDPAIVQSPTKNEKRRAGREVRRRNQPAKQNSSIPDDGDDVLSDTAVENSTRLLKGEATLSALGPRAVETFDQNERTPDVT